ncbi:uncharacterized protein LOC9640571 [Selaginella moellendorffii]|uniref:uncharacterized protein LOC9640571 n=1 Tax=Selaginella moellendorffii TaxID=88036 RepID=UPI000D1C842F|nr:uncharacterized protein LOC9640571 [Selaginella moellendorffii]|eukprot:XP_024515460.1 uncharacterized protein LOC9640571 [Selaginella moellendorffii]
MTRPSPKSPRSSSCSYPDCFLCAIKFSPPDIYARQASFFSELFKELPSSSPSSSSADAIAASSKQQLSIIRGLWSTAMAHPDDPLFVQLGILESMIHLIYKGLRDPVWLSQGENVFVPYYAAHILGSYTMNVERYAAHAVRYRAVPALAELAMGALTWVEQRVAVRCLSHLASYDSTFPAVSAGGVLRLAMAVARGGPGLVYEQFVGKTVDRQLGYHKELLARGSSGEGVERKAEEWASQLQCWSLQVLNCFALREEFLLAICRPEFLVDLPGMWGGLVNGSSPAGLGLLRTICYHKLGRIAIASCGSIVEALCNVARSSDDWQFMAVDCLLWLLQDPSSRSKVYSKAVVALADLVELSSLGEQKKPGESIMDVLLSHQKQDELLEADENVLAAIEDVARLKKRIKIERHLAREDIKITQAAALVLRLEGNARFSAGDVRGAAAKYSEALEVCPIKAKKDRVVILNNRAQCYLLMGDAERAVSDTTRALSLCRGKRRRHGMTSSLWRRAQAYDMMGLAKESLLDALVFGCSSSSISSCSASSDGWDESGSRSSSGGNQSGVNFYVAKLVRKQMQRTWLFREAARKSEMEFQPLEEEDEEEEEERSNEREEDEEQSSGDESGDESEWETASESEMYKISQRNQQQRRQWKR